MKSFWVLLLIFFGCSAGAQESRMKVPKAPEFSTVVLYPVNVEVRYERGSSQDLEARQPVNFALGYLSQGYGIYAEYSAFSETTGNSTSSIDRTHREMTLWARYNFLRGRDNGMHGFMYVAGGLGGYEEEVTTNFMGASREDKAGMKLMGGAALGVEAVFMTKVGVGFSLGVEGRVLGGADFDPNPNMGGLLRLGLHLAM